MPGSVHIDGEGGLDWGGEARVVNSAQQSNGGLDFGGVEFLAAQDGDVGQGGLDFDSSAPVIK